MDKLSLSLEDLVAKRKEEEKAKRAANKPAKKEGGKDKSQKATTGGKKPQGKPSPRLGASPSSGKGGLREKKKKE